jgi:MFS family permease
MYAIILRFATGFLQIFMCVFGPVWVDRFVPERLKSTYLTLLLLGTPLGVVLGYGLSFVCVSHGTWRWAYYIQLIVAVPEALCFLAFPARFMDI